MPHRLCSMLIFTGIPSKMPWICCPICRNYSLMTKVVVGMTTVHS
jgi:hypothetical protein